MYNLNSYARFWSPVCGPRISSWKGSVPHAAWAPRHERSARHARPELHAIRWDLTDMLAPLARQPCTHKYGEILCVLLLKFGNRIRLLLLALMMTNMICVAYMHNYTCVFINQSAQFTRIDCPNIACCNITIHRLSSRKRGWYHRHLSRKREWYHRHSCSLIQSHVSHTVIQNRHSFK